MSLELVVAALVVAMREERLRKGRAEVVRWRLEADEDSGAGGASSLSSLDLLRVIGLAEVEAAG